MNEILDARPAGLSRALWACRLIQQLEVNQAIHNATKILEDYEQQSGHKRRHET